MTLHQDLYEMLRSGMSQEEVADVISKALNAAQKDVDTEREEARRAEEAKRVEEELRERKIVEMCKLIDYYQSYLSNYYSTLGETMSEEENRDLAVSMVDVLDRMSKVGKNVKIDLKFADGTDAARVSREIDKMFDLFSPFGGKRGLFS